MGLTFGSDLNVEQYSFSCLALKSLTADSRLVKALPLFLADSYAATSVALAFVADEEDFSAPLADDDGLFEDEEELDEPPEEVEEDTEGVDLLGPLFDLLGPLLLLLLDLGPDDELLDREELDDPEERDDDDGRLPPPPRGDE